MRRAGRRLAGDSLKPPGVLASLEQVREVEELRAQPSRVGALEAVDTKRCDPPFVISSTLELPYPVHVAVTRPGRLVVRCGAAFVVVRRHRVHRRPCDEPGRTSAPAGRSTPCGGGRRVSGRRPPREKLLIERS